MIGSGKGLSSSLARMLATNHRVVLAARNTQKLADLVEDIDAVAIDCDAGHQGDMENLFDRIDKLRGALSVAIYNPSARSRGPVAELDPNDVERALRITAFGAFSIVHHAAKRMLSQTNGVLLFTGASAGIKGFANSAPFAMGKFALRVPCQSLVRELHPKGICAGHVVIDGVIADNAQRGSDDSQPAKTRSLALTQSPSPIAN